MVIGNDDDYLTVHELPSWFLGRPGINLMSLGLAPAIVWEEEKKKKHNKTAQYSKGYGQASSA